MCICVQKKIKPFSLALGLNVFCHLLFNIQLIFFFETCDFFYIPWPNKLYKWISQSNCTLVIPSPAFICQNPCILFTLISAPPWNKLLPRPSVRPLLAQPLNESAVQQESLNTSRTCSVEDERLVRLEMAVQRHRRRGGESDGEKAEESAHRPGLSDSLELRKRLAWRHLLQMPSDWTVGKWRKAGRWGRHLATAELMLAILVIHNNAHLNSHIRPVIKTWQVKWKGKAFKDYSN